MKPMREPQADSSASQGQRLRVTLPLAAPTTKNRRLLRCLKQHGCEVVHHKQVPYRIGEQTFIGKTIITFPVGTTRRFYIRLQFCDLFSISLPTHLMLIEQCMWDREVSLLTFEVNKKSRCTC